jgi:hypothetical protein
MIKVADLPLVTWSLITGAPSPSGVSSSRAGAAWAAAGAFIDFLLRRKPPRLPLPLSEEAADNAGELSPLLVIFGTRVKLLTSITLHCSQKKSVKTETQNP